jgi:hypothetical protein
MAPMLSSTQHKEKLHSMPPRSLDTSPFLFRSENHVVSIARPLSHAWFPLKSQPALPVRTKDAASLAAGTPPLPLRPHLRHQWPPRRCWVTKAPGRPLPWDRLPARLARRGAASPHIDATMPSFGAASVHRFEYYRNAADFRLPKLTATY